jgi:hypothetical protein
LTEQRTALLQEIDQSQTHLQGSLRDLRSAIEATDALATKLTPTLNAANTLADKLVPPGAPPPSGPPRDVLAEYRAAAEATAKTAERLTALTQEIDRLVSSPSLNGPSGPGALAAVQDSAQHIVDHAFWRLLLVACVAPLVVLGAMWLGRRAAARWKRPP